MKSLTFFEYHLRLAYVHRELGELLKEFSLDKADLSPLRNVEVKEDVCTRAEHFVESFMAVAYDCQPEHEGPYEWDFERLWGGRR